MYPGFGIIRFYHYLCVSNHKSITHTGPLMGLSKIYALRLSERKEYLFSRNDQIPEKDIHLSADSQGEENIDDLYPKEVPREGRLLHLYPPLPPHYPPFHRAGLVLWESFSSTITAPGASIKPFNPLYFIYKTQYIISLFFKILLFEILIFFLY